VGTAQVLGRSMTVRESSSEHWDKAEFRAVFLQHYARIVSILVRLLGDLSHSEEVANDAFWRLYRQPALQVDGNVALEAVGFTPLVVREVRLQITEVRSIATQLAVKGGREEVVVKAPLLQTDNAALGTVIDRGTIVALPLVNRNYTQILGLTAGTNTDVVDATQLGAGSQEIRANGARSGDNNFMLNGVDANSYGANMTEETPNSGGGLAIPAPDTIQEFKVQNSLYDAQYGRGGGANVIIETRSGTAQLRGNAYYFGRNEALDANNFFANTTGVPRGEFRRNQPGGTLGGPMPWSRKRAFFFISYQATRDVNAAPLASSVRSQTVPPIPPLVRTPASLGAIFGGQTGVFGGVAIAKDGSNINPVALNLLNTRNPDGSFVIPSPQIAGSGVNYTAVLPGRYNEDQFNTNLDEKLGNADELSAKFFLSNSDENEPFSGATLPGFPALRTFGNRNLSIAETHVFSPQTVNQFRAGFSRIASRGSAPSPLTAGYRLHGPQSGDSSFKDPRWRARNSTQPNAYTAIIRLRERAQMLFGADLQPDWYVFPSAEGVFQARSDEANERVAFRMEKPDAGNKMSSLRRATEPFHDLLQPQMRCRYCEGEKLDCRPAFPRFATPRDHRVG
jgi:hypothetical protein